MHAKAIMISYPQLDDVTLHIVIIYARITVIFVIETVNTSQ